MRVRVGVVSCVVVVSCVEDVMGTVVVSVVVVVVVGAGVVSTTVVSVVDDAGIGVSVTVASEVTVALLFSETMLTFVFVPTDEGLPLPGEALLE